MPRGIYKRSKEQKEKQSIRLKGKIGPLALNFGNKHTENSKNKMSESHKGHVVLKETRIKISVGLKGFKRPPRSKEHKEKHSLSLLGKKYPNRKKPNPFTEEHLKNMSKVKKGTVCKENTKKKIGIANSGINNGMYGRTGEKNPNWKDGSTPKNVKIRTSKEMNIWKKSVFKRDDWTCQKTKVKGCKLNAHHIKNFAQYPEFRFDVNNGIALSEKTHRKFHKIYGKTNNTKEQLLEFLNIKNI